MPTRPGTCVYTRLYVRASMCTAAPVSQLALSQNDFRFIPCSSTASSVVSRSGLPSASECSDFGGSDAATFDETAVSSLRGSDSAKTTRHTRPMASPADTAAVAMQRMGRTLAAARSTVPDGSAYRRIQNVARCGAIGGHCVVEATRSGHRESSVPRSMFGGIRPTSFLLKRCAMLRCCDERCDRPCAVRAGALAWCLFCLVPVV